MVKFDIECDWHLLDTCNYRCQYCYFDSAFLSQKLREYATVEGWCEAFNRTGLTWLLHMTGGEPTIYRNFVSLCERLSQTHFLSINSNLSHSCVRDFATTIDPNRVLQINASLHPEERSKRNDTEAFAQKVQLLRHSGHRVTVSVVATPAVLADFEAIVEHLGNFEIVPIPKIFYGMHSGIQYPAGYTRHQRAAFLLWSEYASLAHDHGDQDSLGSAIDIFSDAKILTTPMRFQRRICRAGRDFVRLDKDGSVHRCSSKMPLGNILNGTFNQLAAPALCDTSYCEYFCRKFIQ
ncbi:radical SAM protein [Rhizobium sp. WYCCWR 11146]|uniref:radical SAM protein n=1 Tax=Rhizobium sp. WYCCWR 11146 TaxID=2749833 RepID=UPI0015E641C4|nr:radical SAM protein [Rhizobium sp. WYCCWR 11146]MBA1344966.1 radical SAM protein [Rhizobium sp. WYCCWR 11146]